MCIVGHGTGHRPQGHGSCTYQDDDLQSRRGCEVAAALSLSVSRVSPILSHRSSRRQRCTGRRMPMHRSPRRPGLCKWADRMNGKRTVGGDRGRDRSLYGLMPCLPCPFALLPFCPAHSPCARCTARQGQ